MNHRIRNTHLLIATLIVSFAAYAHAQPIDWEAMDYTSHADLQATDSSGAGTFPMTEPIKVKGVLLHHSTDMLNVTPGAPGYLGGMWQTFFQTVEPDDFGGTALWMGQYIGKITGTHPAGSYTDQEWLDEIYRLTHDPITDHEFQPGDLVEIRARAPGLHYKGKTNINEQHSNNPLADFDIYLLEADHGIPHPTLLVLSDLKDANDIFIFDASRATGCEHYQGTLVRINDITLVDASGWGPNADLCITDGTATFPIKLALGSGYIDFPAPTGAFDIIGILDQEDADDGNGLMSGYRLWVSADYDGNGCTVPAQFIIPGDMNCDGAVDMEDVEPFVLSLTDPSSYESTYDCCDISAGDVDGNSDLNGLDIEAFLAILLPE